MKIAEFETKASTMNRDAFVSHYQCPFLKITEKQGADANRAFQTIDVSQLDLNSLATPNAPLIFPVQRAGSSEGSMVTVGRARNMDIVLDSPSVSKLHAYFQKDVPSGEWTIADPGSTNGTTVNGTKLAAKEPVAVKEGDVIEFAALFRGIFMSAEQAYTELKTST